MTGAFVPVALAIGLLVAVALHRVARGPTVPDRLVGAALATANSVVLLVVLGFLFERVEMFVDIALAYALLAFLFPIALAKHLDREADAQPTEGWAEHLEPDDGTDRDADGDELTGGGR